MKLGTKGQYAVMAMVDLAGHGVTSPVPLVDIAERQSLPLAYLEQLFARLRKAGLVVSTRGQSGGYMLSQAPQKLSVADVLYAVGITVKATRCESSGGGGCLSGSERCATHALWMGLGDHMHQYLASISLSDVSEKRVS